MIERCLAKDPRRRYAHTADLAADLKQVRDRLAEVAGGESVARPESARRPFLMWVLSSAVLSIVALGVGITLAPRGFDLASYRYTPLATDAGYQGGPAWSPDGKTLAYVAEADGVVQVFTRSLASAQRAQVTHSRFDCHDPFWSPDGTRIYYHSLAKDRDALWAVSAAGGPSDPVIYGATASAISPDGKTLAVLREEPEITVVTLWFSSPPGAEPQKYSRLPFEGPTRNSSGVLHYSPDGSKLLLWLKHEQSSRVTSREATGFWLVSRRDADARLLLPSLSGQRAPALFSWLTNSRDIVLVRDDGPTPGGHLWIGDTESDSVRPLTVTNGNEGSPSVAPDGRRIAFTSEATDFDLVLVPLDGAQARPFLSSTRNEFDPAWSPNAAQYAFVTDRSGTQEIWLRSEKDEWEKPLVTDADFAERTIVFGALAFSPDGQRLAYQRYSEAGYRIWISTVAGGPPVRLVAKDDFYQDAPTWSPDGDWIAFTTGPKFMVAKVRVGGGAAPVVLHDQTIPFSRPQWSPDGKWILCQTPDGLMLVSSDGGTKRILSVDEWLEYAWAADGSRVYGLRVTDDLHHFLLAALDVKTGRQFVINANLGAIPQANQPIRGFSRVRGDGFLTSLARVRSDIWLLEGFRQARGFFDRLWPFGRSAAPGFNRP